MLEFIKNIRESFGKFEEVQEKHRKKLDEFEKELRLHRRIHNLILGFVSVIIITCFLAFLGFTYDYLKFTSEYRQRLHDKLEQLENKNDSLKINQIINSRLDKLDDKLQTPQDTTSKK